MQINFLISNTCTVHSTVHCTVQYTEQYTVQYTVHGTLHSTVNIIFETKLYLYKKGNQLFEFIRTIGFPSYQTHMYIGNICFLRSFIRYQMFIFITFVCVHNCFYAVWYIYQW